MASCAGMNLCRSSRQMNTSLLPALPICVTTPCSARQYKLHLGLGSPEAAFLVLQGLCISFCRPLSSCLIGLSGASSSAAVLACCFPSSAGGRPAQLSQLKSPPLISTIGACTALMGQVRGEMPTMHSAAASVTIADSSRSELPMLLLQPAQRHSMTFSANAAPNWRRKFLCLTAVRTQQAPIASTGMLCKSASDIRACRVIAV